MFCCSPSALVPQDKLQLRHVVKVHKLGDMPGPPPTPGPIPILPLNKVEPPTPDLTAEEIAKIQANLANLHSFIKDCWIQQTEVITECWARLQSEMNKNQRTPDESAGEKWKKFFENFYEVAALVETFGAFVFPPLAPAFIASAAICGTISALLSTNGSDIKNVIGVPDISNMAANHFQLNDAWYNNMIKTIDYLMDNTNANRDIIFTNTNIKKEATLRKLIDITFTNSGTCYDNWLTLCKRIFKKNLVLGEMAKPANQFLDLYFIQDNTSSYSDFGYVYEPCAVPTMFGCERKRDLSVEGVGEGASIWANDEVRHFRPDYEDVWIKGKSNDLFKSWITATGDFLAKVPSAYIFPWAINEKTIYTQKYFLIESFDKMKDGGKDPQYNLAHADFLNWFFIADGMGNITNPDGVAFRYTIFRSGNYGHGNDIFLHAQQITNDIIDVKDGNWKTTCLDYIFGPKDSSEMNNKFQVYTGDLLLNMPIIQQY